MRVISAILLLFFVATTLAQDDGEFDLALTGDSIISQRLSPFEEPEFLEMIDLLRGADVAITNFESIIHNGKGFPSHSTGTYMSSPALSSRSTVTKAARKTVGSWRISSKPSPTPQSTPVLRSSSVTDLTSCAGSRYTKGSRFSTVSAISPCRTGR